MGRTLPTATMFFMQEQDNFSEFRLALCHSDQLALDDLFVMARNHSTAASFTANALPMETFLLAMLLEEHKEVILLRNAIEHLECLKNKIKAAQIEESGKALFSYP